MNMAWLIPILCKSDDSEEGGGGGMDPEDFLKAVVYGVIGALIAMGIAYCGVSLR